MLYAGHHGEGISFGPESGGPHTAKVGELSTSAFGQSVFASVEPGELALMINMYSDKTGLDKM